MSQRLTRRQFISTGSAALFLAASPQLRALEANTSFDPWQPGFLDIHHISTGRGNSVLTLAPDGTTLMIDAGAVKGPSEALAAARPDGSRRPGEWIARYTQHHLRTAPRQQLDYFLLTHFHADHMGELTPNSPSSTHGDYRLTGVTDVAELLPIRTLIDRGYPTYDYPATTTYDATLNYIRFVRAIDKHNTTVERLAVGSDKQITLQHKPTLGFNVRNLAANGEVWTGRGDETKSLFPPLDTLQPNQYPPENPCSCAIKMSYGPFSYYIGGDLTSDTLFGTAPWLDVETSVAQAAGPVTVAALDHHGYYDATGVEFVRAMRSRIYILQSWHASHPALSTLDKLYSPLLYPGPRDVLATGLTDAAELADGRLSDRFLSKQGHIVIRVHPGGSQYEVIVLDDTREAGNIKARFGPYTA
jgi:beta-lactamase superfamily II metal-dependent hydrolase